LQFTDDEETSDVFDFGDHQFNETFEAADDAKYDTISGN
jgi:ribosomal protein RSM22 (predicted rRNA methylase)